MVPANEDGLIRETRLDWHGDPFVNKDRCLNLHIWLGGAFQMARLLVISNDGNIESSRLLSADNHDWEFKIVYVPLEENQTLSIQCSTENYLTQNGVLAIDEVINKPYIDSHSCFGDGTTSVSTSTTLPTEPPKGI